MSVSTRGNSNSASNLNFRQELDLEETQDSSQIVHLRVQQRSARNRITIAENLADDLDLKRILKSLKKSLSCNGSIKRDEKTGREVLLLSGEQIVAVQCFLVTEGIYTADQIRVHAS